MLVNVLRSEVLKPEQSTDTRTSLQHLSSSLQIVLECSTAAFQASSNFCNASPPRVTRFGAITGALGIITSGTPGLVLLTVPEHATTQAAEHGSFLIVPCGTRPLWPKKTTILHFLTRVETVPSSLFSSVVAGGGDFGPLQDVRNHPR